jgi:hypothetical protein
MRPLLCLFLLYCCFTGQAQVLRPRVLATAGSSQVATTGNAILSFTVGETAIATLNQAGISYGQGFHNGTLIIVATEDLDLEAWKLRIFPNPTSESLYIDFSQPGEGAQLHASVWNLLGQCLSKPIKLDQAGAITLDVAHFPPGVYVLQLKDSSGRTGSIRFVKV